MTVYSHSADETRAFGKRLAQECAADTVCLYGDLGCGKTELVKGYLEGLGYNGDVTSPTYALCHRYDADKTVLHYDLYRLCGYDDLYSVGFFDREPGTVCLIEWSENAEEYLPDDAVRVYMEYGEGPEDRVIRLEGAERK